MLTNVLKKLVGRAESRFSLDDPEILTIYQDERRIRPRIEGTAPILAYSDGVCAPGTMLDVSAQGARCRLETPLEVGAEVTITFQLGPQEFYSITGHAVRSIDNEIGLRFQRELKGRRVTPLAA